MARTRPKRRRKHRGTQAGTVERSAHNTRRARSEAPAKPRTKEEARADARRRREERLSRPPTWRGTLNRAAIAAAIVAAVTIVIGDAKPLGGLMLGVFSLLLYIPLGYALDRAFYRRAQRRRAAGGRPG